MFTPHARMVSHQEPSPPGLLLTTCSLCVQMSASCGGIPTRRSTAINTFECMTLCRIKPQKTLSLGVPTTAFVSGRRVLLHIIACCRCCCCCSCLLSRYIVPVAAQTRANRANMCAMLFKLMQLFPTYLATPAALQTPGTR